MVGIMAFYGRWNRSEENEVNRMGAQPESLPIIMCLSVRRALHFVIFIWTEREQPDLLYDFLRDKYIFLFIFGANGTITQGMKGCFGKWDRWPWNTNGFLQTKNHKITKSVLLNHFFDINNVKWLDFSAFFFLTI